MAPLGQSRRYGGLVEQGTAVVGEHAWRPRRRGCGRSSPGTPGTGRRVPHRSGTADCRRPRWRSSSRWTTRIITLDDPPVIAAHPDPRQPRGSYDMPLGGLHTAQALITTDGRQSGIQLALTPLGARALPGTPAAGLANRDGDATRV